MFKLLITMLHFGRKNGRGPMHNTYSKVLSNTNAEVDKKSEKGLHY